MSATCTHKKNRLQACTSDGTGTLVDDTVVQGVGFGVYGLEFGA